MSIAQIVDEIDAYLSLLRTARDFLAAPENKAQLKPWPRERAGVMLGGEDSRSREKRPPRDLKSRSTANKSERTAKQRRFQSVSSVPGDVPPRHAVADKTAGSAAAPGSPQASDECVLPPSGTSARISRVRRSATKEVIRKEPSSIRPAIALSEGLKTRVVVVPAEQVRWEREEAARRPVPRPQVPTGGGRSAFEALFKDDPDSV